MRDKTFGLLLVLIFCLFQSCGFIKLNSWVDSQIINFSKSNIDFKIKDNRIMLLDSVNFYLDIGAPNVIFKSEIHNFSIKDSILIGSLENVNGKTLENKVYVFDEIQNTFFSIKNAVFRVVTNNNFCLEAYGLIGCELFQNKIVGLDFETNKLNILYENSRDGYQEAKVTDFDGFYFIIELLVNGIKINAKIDTGNPHDLLLKKRDFNLVKNEVYNLYSVKDSEIDTLINSISTIHFENTFDESNFIIKSNNHIKRNLLGVGFMKNYNWIFDFKKGKVFYKNIEKNIPFYQKNKVIANNGKLIYYQTTTYSNIPNLNYEIITVNNLKITPNTICKIQSLLNNTEDWEPFEIILANNLKL